MAAVLRSICSPQCKAFILTVNHLPTLNHAANISSKALRDLNGVKRPPPYDYKNKGYNLFQSWFDRTTPRIDENSKIVLIEGPISAGKHQFGLELAKELDMRYIPHANMDEIYITETGFDLRTFDPKLPRAAQTFDEKKFLANPKDKMAGIFQGHMYRIRYWNYIEALAHLFSTGQGVVLNRSAYSDIVFLEAMYRTNLLSKNAYRTLKEVRENTLQELMKPHLVIYLDVPADVAQKRIKEGSDPSEKNSPLFKDTNFLSTVEKIYKEEFLQDIAQHAELLVYDWSNGGDTELVVEDIERIDFDRFEKEDEKMKDWKFMPLEPDWGEARMKYTQDAHDLYCLLDIPNFEAPELIISPDDKKARDDLYEAAPGIRRAYGYDPELGDKGLLLKNKTLLSPRAAY